MNPQELYQRIKRFALDVISLYVKWRRNDVVKVLGMQLLRSATSVGANYREANKARSRADFLSKIQICESECEESHYWLELLDESGLIPQQVLAPLLDEANQLCAIFSATVLTTKGLRNQ